MPRLKQKQTHSRQRQRLIDACISALHIYGPSRTTVEKVVAIAKLSPGIVRFYFASKAAMLVASLQFLATEFDEQVLAPVSRLKDKPVAALRLLVQLYLDPALASPRKVSVWYAFWGEASSRQEYYDICGQKDEGFAALVREIIERLIAKSGQTHLDADAVALGLIGVLEMLWQDFAFKDEQDIDRAAARERAMAYLRSVFPDQFLASSGPVPGGGAEGLLSARAYHDAHLYALEREHVFQNSWQFAAHGAELQAPGCFVSTDLGFERVLVVRDAGRRLRAFRNSCPAAPHALVAPGDGRQQVLRCAVHGLAFGLDGKALAGTADLLALEVRQVGEWVLVRAADRAHRAAFADHWHKLDIAPGARPLPALADTPVAADWKVVAELFLGVQGLGPQEGWSAEHYRRLTRHTADASGTLFLAPNHWVGLRPDGWTLRQVLPIAPGRCALRQYRYSWCEDEAMARAAQYLADRSSRIGRAAALQVAESIQHGLVMLGHRSAQERSPEVSAFHRQLISVLPMLGLPAGMEGSEDL
jgi:TetR/AcrR family transcriptional repressor of bet genes